MTEIENRLMLPQKRNASEAGRELAAARQKALNLPDRDEVSVLSTAIAQLADRQNVVVEWRARDFDPASVAVSCCCCCCCCL